ncbi:MAG TPA: isoprenylcysteine carboxylmethyltransferase family protein [Tepidisphaeraceae bacterium]|nr:isoprenylcysteine carboxylmethyltransferase family protein [Tepidisphaeraceae bacterium]
MPPRLPPFLLGLLVAAYWARVGRMVYKVHRRGGRAANLVPPTVLGRALRMVWTPIVLIWIGLPFFTAFAHDIPRVLKPMYYSPWLAWPALAMAAACFALTLFCWKTMGRHWRMGVDPAEKNPLIITGPFAYVRHPIYALSQAMMLATMLMIPSPLMLLDGGLHLALMQLEARLEERHMAAIHGPQYADYRAAVGRFIPRKLGG